MTELGERLGAGRAAEVFAYGEGRVIKLLREGGSVQRLKLEAAAQRAAHAVGLPVPEVFAIERVDDRDGLVMALVEGLDGLTAVDRKPWRVWSIGRQVGRLHRDLGRSQAPPELAQLRETLRRDIASSEWIPESARPRLIALLDSLPDGPAICHQDFHPANVIESPGGPMVIDFSEAQAGDPLADFAKSLVILEAGSLPPGASRSEQVLAKFGRRIMTAAYRSGYLAAGPIDQQVLRRWRPVLVAQRLMQGIEMERVQLLRMLSRSFRALQ